ncbi:MAG TPA: hypothetical protein VG095_08165, partial [Chthoniobacterales bacterium]|nr:hypothetical protein [Chthoniobacterales bacterium]
PPALEAVLRRALEKDPARRYQSAAEFRADLKRIAERSGATEAAKFETRERRARYRERIFRAVATLSLLALLFGGALYLGQRMSAPPNDSALRKSLAILPFASLSRDEADALFADGMHDQLLTDLAKVAQLKVIGRTSVMQYKPGAARDLRQISAELKANFLLEGSVQRIGDRVRINARLMDASRDEPLWAESYDRHLADVFDIQNEIATAITTKLHATVSTAEAADLARKPTADLRAFELYTRGRALLSLASGTVERQEENARAAIDLLTQATQRDPKFVLAWDALARAHGFLYWTGIERTAARLALAQTAVDAAWNAAPDSGEAHLGRAELFYIQRNFAAAKPELAAARAKLPNDVRTIQLGGYMLRRQGFFNESTHELETAAELDPRNPSLMNELAINYQMLRRFPESVAALERVLAIDPQRIHARLAIADLRLRTHGELRPYEEVIERALEEDPSRARSLVQARLVTAFRKRDFAEIQHCLAEIGDDGWFGNDWSKFSRLFGEGLLARMKGDTAAAQAHFTAARAKQERLVQAQPEYGPALSVLGLIDAALGRKEEALAEGRRAVELTPREKDALNAPNLVTNLAAIAGMVGEDDLAISILRQQAGDREIEYGLLKLDPIWDPLRKNPRFQELLESLAPKE